MVKGLKREISKLYVVYVTNIKALVRCAVTAPYIQYTGFLSKQYYKCILRAGMEKGAIPAACLFHALYKELPAGS